MTWFGSGEKYRLHTKKDEDEKNLVSKSTVVKGVFLQQAIQVVVAIILFTVPIETVSRNQLSSLLRFEAQDRDKPPQKDIKSGVLGSAGHDIDFNELKAEAEFLKACGTLPQTPTELRNNEKPTDSRPHNDNMESSAFHSWL